MHPEMIFMMTEAYVLARFETWNQLATCSPGETRRLEHGRPQTPKQKKEG